MTEILLSYLKAFTVGGAICTVAQLLINKTKLTAGKILVIFMLAGVFLHAVGVYQYIVDFAGAGATVPISGFGYVLADGAISGAKQDLIGALTGGFKAATVGVCAAIVFSFLVALVFKPKSKRN